MSGPSGYGWYSAGVASWFGAWGMQGALFSWLLVGELQASNEWVGVAQTSTMIPALFLVLFGGAYADRVDPRRTLIALHAVMAVPVGLLAVAVAAGQLSIRGLIAFGLTMGAASAFAMPARDSLLSRVSGDDMMRAVTRMTAVQFGAQALGALGVAGARFIGSVPMICIQGLVLGLGALAAFGIPAVQPARRTGAEGSALREIAEGLAVVARTPNLRVPIGLVLAVGTLFVGPFVVLFPLLVRDLYGGGIDRMALVMALFPIGTITGSLLLVARGGVTRKGSGALFALAAGGVSLGIIGMGLPFWGMVVMAIVWGMCGAVFINCSRTLYQEAAPPTQRGRVLGVYQLGFLGAAPIGSIASGFISAEVGVLPTMRFFGAAMLVLVAIFWAFTNASRMR